MEKHWRVAEEELAGKLEKLWGNPKAPAQDEELEGFEKAMADMGRVAGSFPGAVTKRRRAPKQLPPREVPLNASLETRSILRAKRLLAAAEVFVAAKTAYAEAEKVYYRLMMKDMYRTPVCDRARVVKDEAETAVINAMAELLIAGKPL